MPNFQLITSWFRTVKIKRIAEDGGKSTFWNTMLRKMLQTVDKTHIMTAIINQFMHYSPYGQRNSVEAVQISRTV